MPSLERRNATKRDTGGHILTEWPFCHVKSAIEHKRRYAHRFIAFLVSKKRACWRGGGEDGALRVFFCFVFFERKKNHELLIA